MIAIVAIGVAFLVLPGALREPLTQVRPRLWVRLSAGAMVTGSALMAFGLLAMATPTLLTGIGAHHLAALCRRLIHDTLALGHPGGIGAAFLLLVIGFRAVTGMLAVRRERHAASIEGWVGTHHRGEDHDLVVVPTATPIAMSSTVPRARIILSTGLVDSLRREEVEMVVRHELSHIRGHHHRYLGLARVIDTTLGFLPLVRSSTQVLRLGLERWADEEAAGSDPVSRRVLRSALLRTTALLVLPGYVSLGAPEMLTRRAEALAGRPTVTRIRWWHPAAVSLAAVTAATAGVSSLAVLSVSLTPAGLCYF